MAAALLKGGGASGVTCAGAEPGGGRGASGGGGGEHGVSGRGGRGDPAAPGALSQRGPGSDIAPASWAGAAGARGRARSVAQRVGAPSRPGSCPRWEGTSPRAPRGSAAVAGPGHRCGEGT